MRNLVDERWMMEDGGFVVSFIACVNTVRLLRKTLVQTVDELQSYAQVVFATLVLGINNGFIRMLSKLSPQLCTPGFLDNNRLGMMFIHTVHSPNNKYYKGD